MSVPFKIASLAPLSRRPTTTLTTSTRKTRTLRLSCESAITLASKDVSYRPPGTQINLLNGVSFSLPEKSFGLIFGRSGSGKTTLLQLIAGLSKPTSGSICIQRYGNDGTPSQSSELLPPERVGIVFQFPESNLSSFQFSSSFPFRLSSTNFGLIFGRSGSGKTTLLQLIAGLSKPTSGSICIQRYGNDGTPSQSSELLPPERVGIVFQFPERFFVADTVIDEVTFGWPRQKGGFQLREILASRLQRAIASVGLHGISLDKDPHSLSVGYKRRLALAVQLVNVPDLLVLDEPLAGLDRKARADVVKLLKHLKKEVTLLVVSHDLKELVPLVDRSWKMEMGGRLEEEPLPV